MSSDVIKNHNNHKNKWITCNNCNSPPKVFCRSAQCYDCLKARVLRIFKQTLRTKIISKMNISLAKSEAISSNSLHKRIKIAVLCSNIKYGLGPGFYASRLLLYLLLMRNAHRKRLCDMTSQGILNSVNLDEFLITDDMEIIGMYMLDDQKMDYNEVELAGCKLPIKWIILENHHIFDQIDNESLEAGRYCRNLEAIKLVKTIPADLVLVANCLEDVALDALCHSMLGLGGGSIARNQYLQPLTSSGIASSEGIKTLFIGRPFRDLMAKEIYLLARHENLIGKPHFPAYIHYLYPKEFLLEIGEKHPNSIINIAKLTAGSDSKCIPVNLCSLCKFENNRQNGNICSACLEISKSSEKAKNFLHSLI